MKSFDNVLTGLSGKIAWIEYHKLLSEARIGLVEQFTKALRIMFSNTTNAPATYETLPRIYADTIPLLSSMSKPAAAYADENEIGGTYLLRLVRDEAVPLRSAVLRRQGDY